MRLFFAPILKATFGKASQVSCWVSIALGLLAGQACAKPAFAERPPNELGRIPILMYHSIGGDAEFAGGPRYDKHGLNIAPETFRRQLELMYASGWYPVDVRDILTARLNVPRGKTPVAITFDDARASQFRYLENGKIDPDCAVGILEAFHKAHPDWPCQATFYVLPESQYNGVPFDQDGQETKKLRFLAQRGYELGNHTTSHRSLAAMNADTLCWEMGFCARYFRRQVPSATLQTMALPYGIAPNDRSRWRYLLNGSWGGTHYHNRCIVLAKGGLSYDFADRRFDRTQVPRVEAAPGAIERWLSSALAAKNLLYVSDGDPATLSVPKFEVKNLDRRRLRGVRLVVRPF